MNRIANATNQLSAGVVLSINLDMAIQNEIKCGSEQCRLIADQMQAEADLEPERNQMLLRAAQAWSELANSLKRGGGAAYFINNSPAIRADRWRG